MGNKSSGEKDNEKMKLVDKTDKKREFDPTFKGPIDRRGCTDVVCCCIFGAYMLGMLVVAAIAISQGHPKRLLYPTDSNGKVCGVDIVDKRYLYFFDLTKCITKGAKDPFQFVKHGFSCPTPQVCVSKCPSENINGYEVDSQDMVCAEGSNVKPNMTRDEKEKLIKAEKCAPYYLKSKPILYRCLPDVLTKAFDKANIRDSDGEKVNGSDIHQGEKAIQILISFRNIAIKVCAELKLVWPWLLCGFFLSMLLSVVYIVLARWITFPLVIISSLGVLGLLGYSSAYMFIRFKELHDAKTSKDIVWRLSMNASDFTENKNFWLTIGILLVIVLAILLLVFIFLYPRLRLACGLITEASKAVCTMLSTLFFPLLPWIFQFVWVAWFVGILLFLMSNGTKQYQVSHNDTMYNLTVGEKCNHDSFASEYPQSNSSCVFAKYKENDNLLRMIVFHLFGWLWGMNFIIAFSECSLAGAFASYYWAFNKPKDIPSMPVVYSMWRSLSCHTGSLALGAAIIAIVQLIRITLEYIHRKLKENTDNPVADFVMKCLKCCFWCLEKCLRFINKNAYIMIAIYGKNFCASARDAVFLMTRNIASTVTINGVTSFILLLGKLMVTGLIAVASFFWFSRYDAFLPHKLHYSVAPIVINTIAAFLVAKLFFSVYDMGIDTLFLSYLEDIERNDGTPEKPYYMTKSLQDIMDKRNQKAPSAPQAESMDLDASKI